MSLDYALRMNGDTEISMQVHETCQQCGDDFDGHAVIMTTDEPPLVGGIVLCPEPGCTCFSTWSKNGENAERIHVPDENQIAQLRQAVQEVYSS